ncbi:Longin-like domain-containing protein [Protomyces lactucae-debilis]|uniref:Protein transport protein SEC22 n=1 Tax=Protomyces lactucae-debilis TaxID=2754530 RepID=A0A1Y2FNC4_PROLT|nr:Longin-like domain-containing protein [Protomyces lactucae-debilis]ORY85458.1 Longin-like domain-containing protein [Protomyces lactucae-debilis]
MVKSTSIARIQDGLPLAATVDDEQAESALLTQKQQAKQLFRKLANTTEQAASVESGPYFLHYMIEDGICYLCIADKSYPRKLAFNYLSQVAKEFATSYGQEAQKQGLRPYAFVQFENYLQKTTREYLSARNSNNLDKLNEDLNDVTRIMTRNIDDLLNRGESLDKMSTLSSTLRDESVKYRKAARNVNLKAMLREYGLYAGLVLFLLLIVYWRLF